MRKRLIIAPLIALVLLTGCAKTATTPLPPNVSALNTGANITLNLAKGIRIVENGIRSANASGFVDTPTTASVLRITRRINEAGIQADNILKTQAQIAQLSPDQKLSIKTLLDPLVMAIQASIDTDVIKISNTSTRAQVQSSLTAIQLTIKTTLAALGGN